MHSRSPWIVIVSTPYKPGDLFERIDRDPNSIFRKLSFLLQQLRMMMVMDAVLL